MYTNNNTNYCYYIRENHTIWSREEQGDGVQETLKKETM